MDAEKYPQLGSNRKKKKRSEVRTCGKTTGKKRIKSKDQGLILNHASKDRYFTLNNCDFQSMCSNMLRLFATVLICLK